MVVGKTVYSPGYGEKKENPLKKKVFSRWCGVCGTGDVKVKFNKALQMSICPECLEAWNDYKGL